MFHKHQLRYRQNNSKKAPNTKNPNWILSFTGLCWSSVLNNDDDNNDDNDGNDDDDDDDDDKNNDYDDDL